MTASSSGVRVGVDIGGTFTDIVLCKPDETLLVGKVSSTPADPAEAVLKGLARILDQAGVKASEVIEVVHGTTVGSNAILQKTGARTGLLTTAGFRDVLEIGRIRTPGMFDLSWEKPTPLVPRRYRLDIPERIDSQGNVVAPLDRDAVRAAGAFLKAEGVESIAVCFLHSYRNPSHEVQAREILEADFPRAVTISSAVLPEVKEYERTSTSVVNAYILPVMREYLMRLIDGLRHLGIRAPLQVMASNGGTMGGPMAAERPVFVVASGPAGGATGAARLGSVIDRRDLIVFDMGGTTAKACIVENGLPMLTTEYEFRDGISAPSRFIKGGGYMLKVPAVDLAEVGAGGGSIAAVDSGGLLVVGPESAGADPGPACYERGNDLPTVTDANMVLGYLNPKALAGGTLPVNAARSRAAVEEFVARPLGLSVEEAAHGIRQVANANMARAIRSVTIERGRDPRDMALMSFGGGGALHAVDVARLLGIKSVLVPPLSGVFCALGMLSADIEHSFVRAVIQPLDGLAAERLAEVMDELAAEGRAVLAEEGYANDEVTLKYLYELRYVGQSSELAIEADGAEASELLRRLPAAFTEEYQRTFGYVIEDALELVNVRLVARGVRAGRVDFARISQDVQAVEGTRGRRSVSFSRDEGPLETRLLARRDVGSEPIEGPVVIESYDCTIIVPPGCSVSADKTGTIVIGLDS